MQVNLNLESKAANVRKAQRQAIEGSKVGADYRRKSSGHAFSADNPYGKRPADDKRQFVRI
jgi:ATP-dependent RNA helicase DDX18/HAS1